MPHNNNRKNFVLSQQLVQSFKIKSVAATKANFVDLTTCLYPSKCLPFSSVLNSVALDQTKFLDTVLPSGQNIYTPNYKQQQEYYTCALSCLQKIMFVFV